MNFDNLTPKVAKTLVAAHDLAMTYRHKEFTPIHVATTLIGESGSILRIAIVNFTGGGNDYEVVEHVKTIFNLTIHNLPVPTIAPDMVLPSNNLMKVLKQAMSFQESRVNNHLDIYNLSLGIIMDSQVSKLLENVGIKVSGVKLELQKLMPEYDKVMLSIKDNTFLALNKYGYDLVDKARKLDRVVGRDEEINKVILILSKKTKSNPILVGQPGVGKTAIVEGLAQRIGSGNVPHHLQDVSIFALNIGDLIGGTKYRGEFEERMHDILKVVDKSNKKIILFIDEIHLIIGAGRIKNSSIDAANLMKPMLARGELRCIGATTFQEYRKYIEKGVAFERCFDKVVVDELSVEDTINMLQGLKRTYESHHGILIEEQALVISAKYSSKYILDRFLPDKAMDLLDKACAIAKNQFERQVGERDGIEVMFDELHCLKTEREKLLADAREVVLRHDVSKAEYLRSKAIPDVRETILIKDSNIIKLENLMQIVRPEHIVEALSQYTRIPITSLDKNEKKQQLGMKERLGQRVVGQDEAIKDVVNAVKRSRVGTNNPEKPIGSFLFLGPTGVGKTELAKALAEQLFYDENKLVRIDMSEYMERNSVSKLIGAPLGIVGYDEGGKLTEPVRKRSYTVVLLDEIEKAHRNVLDLLLQVLHYGRLADNNGKIVNFNNTVIILKSNLGAKHVVPRHVDMISKQSVDKKVIEQARAYFKPEFANHIDKMIVFNTLSPDQLRYVVKLQMKDVSKRFSKKGIFLEIRDAAIDYVSKKGYDQANGAKPMKSFIEQELTNDLTNMLLADEISKNSTVVIDAGTNGFAYRVKKCGQMEDAATFYN